MSMKFKDVQATAVNIIKGITAFSAYPFSGGDNLAAHVLADDGLQSAAMEAALKGAGWCVLVSPPAVPGVNSQEGATSTSAATGFGQGLVLLAVKFRTNPKRNAGVNAVNVFVGTGQIGKAFLAWQPAASEKGFRLATERPIEPDFADEGCFSYDLRVTKLVSLWDA